jgi:hypothetical protein
MTLQYLIRILSRRRMLRAPILCSVRLAIFVR